MDDTQEWHEDPIPGMGVTAHDSSTDESDTESDSEYTKPGMFVLHICYIVSVYVISYKDFRLVIWP
jgi:hypothetical protein